MKFNVTAADLRRVFAGSNSPDLNLQAEALVHHLNLDLGHLQLLRDCYQAWHETLGRNSNGSDNSNNTDALKAHLPNQAPIQSDMFLPNESANQNDAAQSNNSNEFNNSASQDHFWVMLLCLVSEVNEGSLCLDVSNEKYQQWFDYKSAILILNSQPVSFFELDGMRMIAFDGERLYFEKYHAAECAVSASLQRLVKSNLSPEYDLNAIKKVVTEVYQSVSFTLSDEQILAMAVSLLQPFSIISGGPGTGKTTIMGSVLRCLSLFGFDATQIALAAPTGRAAYRMTESLRHGLKNDLKASDVTSGLTVAEQGLLSLEATTIHRLLGANPSRKQHRYHAGNLLPYKLIVIDEVSMVDMMLMKQLLSAIANDCRVILLGDQFQLPSVSSGAVLADLMPDVNLQLPISVEQKAHLLTALPELCHPLINTFAVQVSAAKTDAHSTALLLDCVTVLSDSKRCQADIARLSEFVRKGDVTGFMNSSVLQKVSATQDLKSLGDSVGFYWSEQTMDNKQWQAHYEAWLKAHYFEKGHYKQLMEQLKGIDYRSLDAHRGTIDTVFDCIQSNRILTLVNQGEVGNQTINFHVCEMMKNRLDVTGHEHLFHGAVIMVRRNDASLNLFNGDVGVLLEVETGHDQSALRAVFPSGINSGYQSYSIHVIPEFTAAFAMTVHKSQGSEFNHVLMPLPSDTDHRLLSREIIYTGMTRAKTSVEVIANEAALKTGIQRKNNRQTGLILWGG